MLRRAWGPLFDKLERLFEEDLPEEQIILQEDIENLAHLHDVSENRDLVFFSNLSNYFDAGFLFRRRSSVGDWNSLAAFANGQTFVVDPEDSVKLELPQLAFGEVRRKPAWSVLNKLGLESRDPHKKLTALLIQPSPHVSYVLLSRQADPWLRVRTEQLQRILTNFYGAV